jgi:2-polyprenyl-3-methyl-5-hydroxy-6-metoxy-1,4-benzoquinol methylase
MVDAACGGGDVPIAVAQRAKSAGVDVDLTLVDRSDTALAAAKTAADRAEISCQCVRADLMEGWPKIHADVVTSSLFLHHIPDGTGVAKFLSEAKVVARRAIVISDLRRARMGWLVAWFGGRMLSGSKIVHHDGPVSVRAAWTIAEMKKFAHDAGLTGVSITRSFPWRMLLVWESRGEEIA